MNQPVQEVRREFPIVNSGLYLDNASIFPLPTKVVQRATEAMMECSTHGVHKYESWLAVIEQTRELVARLINSSADEIAFTQNTAEGINIVANGIDWRNGDNVVISEFDYYANVYPWTRLRTQGVDVRFIRPVHGAFGPDELLPLVDSRTRVVAVSSVQWVNGLRLDLARFAEIAHSVGAYLVVDAIQSLGAAPIDVEASKIDFLSCGGHKWLMTPFGTGVFFCRREHLDWLRPSYLGTYSHFDPLDYSFRETQVFPKSARKFQHGNCSISGVFGLNASIQFLESLGIEQVYVRNRMLADRIVTNLVGLGYKFLSPLSENMRSHFVTFFPNNLTRLKAEFQANGVAVSERMGGVRVSPAFYNTEDEIDRFCKLVEEIDHTPLSTAERSMEAAS